MQAFAEVTEMKSCAALCLVLQLAAAPVFWSATADSTAEVLTAENAWQKAELGHDADTLSRLMADDVVLTEPDGVPIGKTEEVAFTADPNTRFDILETHGLKVRVHGDTAIVTGAYHEKGTDHGRTFEHQGRFTDTWLRQDGSWRCIASHSSVPVPD